MQGKGHEMQHPKQTRTSLTPSPSEFRTPCLMCHSRVAHSSALLDSTAARRATRTFVQFPAPPIVKGQGTRASIAVNAPTGSFVVRTRAQRRALVSRQVNVISCSVGATAVAPAGTHAKRSAKWPVCQSANDHPGDHEAVARVDGSRFGPHRQFYALGYTIPLNPGRRNHCGARSPRVSGGATARRNLPANWSAGCARGDGRLLFSVELTIGGEHRAHRQRTVALHPGHVLVARLAREDAARAPRREFEGHPFAHDIHHGHPRRRWAPSRAPSRAPTPRTAWSCACGAGQARTRCTIAVGTALTHDKPEPGVERTRVRPRMNILIIALLTMICVGEGWDGGRPMRREAPERSAMAVKSRIRWLQQNWRSPRGQKLYAP